MKVPFSGGLASNQICPSKIGYLAGRAGRGMPKNGWASEADLKKSCTLHALVSGFKAG